MSITRDDTIDAVVVGAGPAGLAVSRELQHLGLQHAVLERGDSVGYTWAHLYDSLVLHTGRHLSSLPGLTFPASTPLFPTRLQFLDYLRRYAETFHLPVETRVDVTHTEAQTDRWLVHARDGSTRTARALIIATGIVANPYTPDLPGRDQFRGRLMHSVDYHRPADTLGRRVLVAGTGNSAGEISAELAAAGAEVTLAVRTGATIVPREVLGVPVQYLGIIFSPLPPSARAAITRGFSRLTGLARGKAVLPPPQRTECPKIPLIGLALADGIRAGKIRVRPGLAGFTAARVVFSDGSEDEFDDVILATGYRAAVSPLRSLIGVDSCGFANRRGPVASADRRGLYFVGHTYSTDGALLNIGRDARRAARAIRQEIAH